jgi:uncharacterized protein (DUF58 family)
MTPPAQRTEPELLSPELLARLSHLQIKIGRRLTGAIVGRHRSPNHGSSIEFKEHKEYAPGDEIRHLDWKAYAKLDRYYIKRFEDETNLRSFLLLDTSASMGYGSTGENKLRYASRLAAALAFILLKQQDSVGLVVFNNQIEKFIPPRSQGSHLQNIIEILDTLSPTGETALEAGLSHVLEHARKNSMVYVLSDFFDTSDSVQKILGHLSRRHEIALMHILDPHEIEFPFENMTLFQSMESSGQILAEPKIIRKTYLREFERFCDQLRRDALTNGMEYQQISTGTSVDKSLLDYLVSRQGGNQEAKRAI